MEGVTEVFSIDWSSLMSDSGKQSAKMEMAGWR
jgi:hypothetical protein